MHPFLFQTRSLLEESPVCTRNTYLGHSCPGHRHTASEHENITVLLHMLGRQSRRAVKELNAVVEIVSLVLRSNSTQQMSYGDYNGVPELQPVCVASFLLLSRRAMPCHRLLQY